MKNPDPGIAVILLPSVFNVASGSLHHIHFEIHSPKVVGPGAIDVTQLQNDGANDVRSTLLDHERLGPIIDTLLLRSVIVVPGSSFNLTAEVIERITFWGLHRLQDQSRPFSDLNHYI